MVSLRTAFELTMLFYFILTVLHAIPAVLAVAYDGPQETALAIDFPDQLGWSPKPTQRAIPFGVEGLHFNFRNVRRQLTSLQNTCGYLSGEADGAITCDSGSACAYQDPRYFGCCSTDTAGIIGSDCIPYTGCFDYSLATACTGACYSNNRVW
jgi:hypothetical protein